jgi:hypothetical protein
MNERIQQLSKQATSIQGPTPYNPLTFEVFDKEKFAQLIVLECAAYLNGAMEVYTQSEQDLYDRGATKIKQHFGVE